MGRRIKKHKTKMSFLHYFSKDPNKRAKFIFNLIAPIYKLTDKALINNYSTAIDILDSEVSIENKYILDIGTGTGAWATGFTSKNAKEITGIDFAEKMINIAKQNNKDIKFIKADGESLNNFNDDSFDIVTASYVIHGVKKEKRKILLSEMKRVSKKHVILHDFAGKTPYFIRFLEFMERSDYRFFKKNIESELNVLFKKTTKIDLNNGMGLYICNID